MKARFKAILKDLLPPVLVRSLRRPQLPHPPAKEKNATVHEVVGGPLKGGSLLLDLSAPAYRAMQEGSYDAFVWPALPEASSIHGLILDIGAHVGYDSLALARIYHDHHVVAFEPNPVNLARIEANLELNPDLAGRVEVQGLALADSTGTLAFHTSDNVDDETSSGGHLGSVRPPLEEHVYVRAGFKKTTVPVCRLDDLAREQGWDRIGLMKIDVEGAEHLVLQGAEGVLRKDRPFLCIEVHSVACMLAVDQLLKPFGYVISMLKEDRPSRAHVVAYPS